MTPLAHLKQLMIVSVRDPRKGMKAVQAISLGRAQLWQILVVLAILAALIIYVGGAASGELAALREAGLNDPFAVAISQVAMIAFFVLVVHWIAVLCGGTGSFDDSMRMVLWLQVLVLVWQVVLVLVSMFVPLHPDLMVVLAAGVLFYLLSHFVAVVHGFASAMSVFLVTFALSFGLAAVVGSFVITYGGMAP